MYIRQHPYGMQSDVHGFSPGLKNMPPAYFLPLLRRGRPLQIPPARYIKKNHIHKGCGLIYGGEGGI